MKFEFLAHRRDAMPILGRWYYREWGFERPGETEEKSVRELERYLHLDRIPFILVATEGNEILGAAQLKFREMEDLFPDKEHWLGGVFVNPQHRGRGIGARLIKEIVRRAPSYGVQTLYLQTEQLDGGLYRQLGWGAVEQVENHGVRVLVMERRVGP